MITDEFYTLLSDKIIKDKGECNMKKSILAVLLTLVMIFSITTPVFAATKTSTKTVTFNSYETSSQRYQMPATVKITNVISQKTKDYSTYLSDDKVTISGKKSKVITCKAPVTITLKPNKGEEQTGVQSFMLSYDSKKISTKSVKQNFKYYTYDIRTLEFDFSKKYDTTDHLEFIGYADGSSYKLTKAGTYVLNVRPLSGVDDSDLTLTPVFIVVK